MTDRVVNIPALAPAHMTRYVWVRQITLSEWTPGGGTVVWTLEADGNGRPSRTPDDAITLGGTGPCPFHVGDRLTVTLAASP